MHNDTPQEKAYWSKEVAEMLKIATPTVRKYCNLMESNGYVFLRNGYNQRAFIQRDIIVLKKIQELIKQKDISVEQAIKTIVSDIPSNQLTPSTTVIENDDNELSQIITRLGEEVNELRNDNEYLKETLDEFRKLMTTQQEQILKQQEYIAASIERRDNQITHLLQQSIEDKKEKKLNWFQRITRVAPRDTE
jgi:type II secretory pathway predicted ATPase ExeA